MSFLNSISKFFGLDREPTRGKWPRKVETWELPPQRMPILDQLPAMPNGLREVTGLDHRGWVPWSSPRSQSQPQNQMRGEIEQMSDYLRDGAAAPPKKRS
jgi:hypothetical protein